MLGHGQVAQNIVVHLGVFARPEVPRFVFGVVGLVLKTLQLVVEVDDIECLLVPQSSVLHYQQLAIPCSRQ